MKRVLVIHYSQTGQLTGLLERIVSPLTQAGIHVDHLAIRPQKPYPFPWSRLTFFNAFPEAVGRDTIPLEPFEVPEGPYDLVILGYTIWYLNPSIPTNSFLLHPQARACLEGRPVLTVIAPRNMWVMAQEYVRGRIADAGGRPVGNISVVDRSGNLTSVVTVIRWMFWGRKDPFLVFPHAGIRQKDMDGAARFGPIIADHLQRDALADLNPALLVAGSARIAPTLLVLERRGLFIFGKWRRFIIAKADRAPASRIRRVKFFSVALPIIIFLAAPISGLSVRIMGLLKGRALKAEIARILRY
ncbi:MAG: dialkylresorcinol condensing enzyme DarA [Flavobacteriales bacterium]|nr:dialkylresorcinol condensing enzyme DarA [Flavobacteriales bacterium]